MSDQLRDAVVAAKHSLDRVLHQVRLADMRERERAVLAAELREELRETMRQPCCCGSCGSSES